MPTKSFILCFFCLFCSIGSFFSEADQPSVPISKSIRLTQIEPLWTIRLTNPPTAQQIEPNGDTVFELSDTQAIGFLSSPFRTYEIECNRGHNRASIEISPWHAASSGYLFRHLVTLRQGQAVFRPSMSFGVSGSLLRSKSGTIKGCKLRSIRFGYTPSSWIESIENLDTSLWHKTYKFNRIKVIDHLADTEAYDLKTEKDLSPEDRRVARLAVAVWKTGPLRLVELTGSQPMHPLYPEKKAWFLSEARFSIHLSSGLYRVRFWPSLQPSETSTAVCSQIVIGKNPVHNDCWNTKPAVWHAPPYGEASASSRSSQGSIVGKMHELRFAIANDNQAAFTWNRPGWISIHRAQPVWNWSLAWKQNRAVILAYYQKPGLNLPGGPEETITHLTNDFIALNQAHMTGTAASREFFTKWYGQSKWVFLEPEQTSRHKEIERHFLAPLCSQSSQLPATSQVTDTLWTAVGPAGESIQPPDPETKLQKISVLFENQHSRRELCFFKLAGRTFSRPIDQTITESRFLAPSSKALGIVSLSNYCRLWIPEPYVIKPNNPPRSSRVRKRFYQLDPGDMLDFNLESTQHANILQLRAWEAHATGLKREVSIAVDTGAESYEARLVEVIPGHAGCLKAARMQFFVPASNEKIKLHNRSDRPVLVSLYIRGEKNVQQSSRRVLPPSEPIQKELQRINAWGKKAQLGASIRSMNRSLARVTDIPDWKSAVMEKLDLLMDRIRAYMYIGNWSAAKDDLVLAESFNDTKDRQAERDILRKTYFHARNYLPAVAFLYGVFPLDPSILPVLPSLSKATKSIERKSASDPRLNKIPSYQAAWNLWRLLSQNKLEVKRDYHLLAWLHASAVEERDWLMAAGVSELCMRHTDDLVFQIYWLRELARANRTGQILDPDTFLSALAKAVKLNHTLKGAASALIDAFSIGSAWSPTFGFTGVAGRIKIFKSQDIQSTQNRDELLWSEDWQESTYWNVSAGASKIIRLNIPKVTQTAFEVRWRQRPMANGHPPACALSIQCPSGKLLSMHSPPTHLATRSSISPPVKLDPHTEDIVAELQCDVQGGHTRAQLRILADKPARQLTTNSHPPKRGFGYLFKSSPQASWLLLRKNRPANLDILGPNLLRLRFRVDGPARGIKSFARIGLTTPNRQQNLVPVQTDPKQTVTETIIPLAEKGTWNIRLSADRNTWFHSSHRSDSVPDNAWVAHPDKLFFQSLETDTTQTAPFELGQPSLEQMGPLTQPTLGALGTIMLSWRTQTDTIEKEIGTFGDNWVHGPVFGWRRCWNRDACLMSDVFLRLRQTGRPATSLVLKGLYELPFGLRFIPYGSFAFQSVRDQIESAYRVSIEMEQAFRPSASIGIYPSVGFQKLDESLDCRSDTIADSEIHSTYQCLHPMSMTIQLRITARPFWESLFIGRVSATTNPNLKPWSPDRSDLSLDGFFGFPGLIINPEAALSVRFVDDERRQRIIRPYFGLHFTKSWWLSENWLILLSAGGRYFTDSAGYDAGLQFTFSWGSGRAMRDYHSKWQPLTSFLAWHQPGTFFNDNFRPTRSED